MGLFRRKGSNVWWVKFKQKGTLLRKSTGEHERTLAEKAAAAILRAASYVPRKRKRFTVAMLGEVVRNRKLNPCADCKQTYPHYVMDFDHLGETAKKASISDLVRRGASIVALRLEMAKCEIVCANCHRERTHRRGRHRRGGTVALDGK